MVACFKASHKIFCWMVSLFRAFIINLKRNKLRVYDIATAHALVFVSISMYGSLEAPHIFSQNVYGKQCQE